MSLQSDNVFNNASNAFFSSVFGFLYFLFSLITSLKNLIEYSIKFFNKVIKENKKYKKPNSNEKKALEALIKTLSDCNDKMLPEEIQTKIYSVGKENGYKDNLRDWFKLIYEVVFGDENGPRLGFFISFFGIQETKELISEKINNV